MNDIDEKCIKRKGQNYKTQTGRVAVFCSDILDEPIGNATGQKNICNLWIAAFK